MLHRSLVPRLALALAISIITMHTHAQSAQTPADTAAPPRSLPPATRPEVFAPSAMTATSHPLATQAALHILRSGGSALDAAIAANACLGLMEPTGCGIGGDLFAIIWDPASKSLHGYNGSGRSPATVTLEQLRAILAERSLDAIPAAGPLSVTVPGCVDGWFALHERFGKLPMPDVLAPAIAYAENGFPLSPRIAEAWHISARRFADRPGFARQYMLGGREEDAGTPRRSPPRAPRAGEMWTNPELAATYRALAERGRDAFYTGEIPAAVESTLRKQLGTTWLTAADFAAHTGEWVTPVSANYRGYDVWELPPNGQGIAALQILEILEGFDLEAMGWGSADHVHAFVEAKKLAFEDRARFYADPAFAKAPVATLISADYAAQRRAKIDMAAAAKAVEPGQIPSGADTIYLTTADASGMMVSLIQSNYRGMGSGVVPARDTGETLGFMLQSRGEQFALIDDHPNAFAPAKRPFHTIIPAFVTKHGAPWLCFGVMGGAMQPQAHAQIIINLIDFKMTLQQAGDAPRIHHDGSTEPQARVTPMTDGGVLNLEPGFPPATLAELERRGHTLKPAPTPVFGGYQAIMFSPRHGQRVWVGASESRKDGQASGY